jgi:NAD-dependent deacetylase
MGNVAVLRARSTGIPTVEINPGRSEVSDVVDLRVAAGAALSLGTLWDRYLARQEPG